MMDERSGVALWCGECYLQHGEVPAESGGSEAARGPEYRRRVRVSGLLLPSLQFLSFSIMENHA